ncbi:hypothetical protein [Micromonospora rhizosphaerae]|nr:hypothetical protein [Micromonospora rhizosphaerae]
MANYTGPQSGNIQNADQIFNYGESRAWLSDGRKLLQERAYRRAAPCFEEFLARDSSEDCMARAEAHVLLVIATLAGCPPSYRTHQQATEIGHHLVAASSDLAAVLAALVGDDYYDSAGISVPPDLAAVAAKTDPTRLRRSDLLLIQRHVAPVPGETWQKLRTYCQPLGIDLPNVASDLPTPPASPERRVGVPKYFIAVPPAPPPERSLAAGTTVFAGVVLIALPCAGLLVETRWYVGLAMLVLAPAAGLLVALIGIGIWRDSQQDQVARRRYEEAKAAAEGGPSKEQMDQWLEEDVRWIVARGARRLRLNPALIAKSGDLLVEPQAAVGVSRLKREETLQQFLSRAGGSTSVRLVRQKRTIGKSRVGPDGKLRSDHYHILVVYLSAHRVAVFMCDLALATRALLTESTYTFHYRDVVSISTRAIVDPRDSEGGIALFDEATGRYVRRFGDSRFTLFLVNGQQMDVSVGVTGESRELEVAWSNAQVYQVVDRMVWSRKEREDSERA